MAVQVSYPGIYIQEFTPGAPIQGVGTSTAAFIGTATSGPINQPTMLTSWDEFQNVFGGFIAEPSNVGIQNRSYLAPAVYGFFLNQGTNCYVVRAVVLPPGVTSLMASAPLGSPVELVATAIAEGTIGNGISVQVNNSSLLTSMLTAAGAPATTLTATAPLVANQLTFQVVLPTVPSSFVLNQALPTGALISITGTGAPVEIATVSSASGNTITLTSPLTNSYTAAPQIASLEFTLVVTAATTETWANLSMNPLHPNYWQSAVNSQYIALSLPSSPPSPVPADPRPGPFGVTYPLSGGSDDQQVNDLADIIANPNTYLDALKPLQGVDIVAIPGVTEANPQQALITHCETMFDRFAVLDAAPDSSVGFPNLLTQYGQVRTPNGFAAIYFPWIQVINPLTGVTEYWPPSGHVMGIYAQTDQNRGVYKAPANVAIAGALGLQSLLTNADQGPLNLLGINILRVFPEQSQPLIWGARTTSTDSDWQYVSTRRLFIYLEQSIEQGIRWAVFEPNNPVLWGKLKRTITEFLNRVQADGGIISFYVRIDSALNPPATQALGQLYIEVGIQPAYPAEFIILRIGIWQGGSSVTES
jgi:uncharacterized protein